MTTDAAQQKEQRFSVGQHSELSVSNVSGHIAVDADEGSEIVVRYSKAGSFRTQDNIQVDIRKDGNRVTVQTRPNVGGLINFGRGRSVDYNITVPRDCAVRLHAVSADVELHGPRAETGIQTVSGGVRMKDIAGDITVTTVSGDIDASQLSGTLVARTTSGNAKVAASRLRRFSINSVSGNFTLETPLLDDEHCNAKTVSGDLNLQLPSDAGATVQLKSISGNVSCELPAEIIKAGRRHWQGRINGGGGNVEMNSVSGDLRILRSVRSWSDGPGPDNNTDWIPTPPEVLHAREEGHGDSGMAADVQSPVESEAVEEPAGEGGPDPTAEILGALERGEITVEEAMEKLG